MSPLVSLFLVVFIDLLGFGLVVPIMPYYAQTFGASATTLGWLMMCYSGMQFIFSPFWGKISDHIGRRPVILLCLFGISLSMLLLGMAPVLSWLFVARLLAGFFGANISTAMAYIADVTKPEERSKGMGVIGAAFGLGFLFGPALGGILSQWGYHVAPLVAAGMAFINLILAFFVLKEPLSSEEQRARNRHAPNKGAWAAALSCPQTATSILLFFLVTLGIALLETSFALYLAHRFQLDAMHAGLLLGMMALVMALIQGRGIGKLVGRFGEVKLILAGTILMAAALNLAIYSPSLGIFSAFLVFHSIGYAITNPSLSGITSKFAPASQQGSIMGVYQSGGSLARVIGPVTAGYIYDKIAPSAPFQAAGIFFLLAFILLFARKNIWKITAAPSTQSK